MRKTRVRGTGPTRLAQRVLRALQAEEAGFFRGEEQAGRGIVDRGVRGGRIGCVLHREA